MASESKTVLVTAGGSGIGRAIAVCFAASGYEVHVCDINQELVGDISRDSSGINASVCDVAKPDQVKDLIDELLDKYGAIDVLVNNAGISAGNAPIEEIENTTWNRALDVNLSGMFYFIKSLTPSMKKNEYGSIVNISTASVRTGMINRLPYIASKEGVIGLTKNVARELGQWKIRCNAILPGMVDNKRGRKIISDKAKREKKSIDQTESEYLKYISMRCWIDPKEVGDLAVFLASEKAKHITGQFIAVDGNLEWEA
ncbi:MAG: SDR family oxidoreductase [Pseudomonadota bacterium]|nr:SDR family oxidoreductase [Pseudomonadota bacterium]